MGLTVLCDISPDYGNLTQARTAELTYSIATGVWWGDDYLERSQWIWTIKRM